MKITIESTSKIVQLECDGGSVPARVWQGESESGIPVTCLIPVVAPEIPTTDPTHAERTKQFDEELRLNGTFTGERLVFREGIPLRFIL